jgi:hypothetical protein
MFRRWWVVGRMRKEEVVFCLQDFGWRMAVEEKEERSRAES